MKTNKGIKPGHVTLSHATRALAAMLLATSLSAPSTAQPTNPWPARSLTMIVPGAAGGTTDIEMRAERLVGEDLVDGNEQLFRVAIDLDAVRAVALLQVLPVGAVAAGADRIVQLEVLTLALHLVHHGDEGRDADAAGHHDVLPGPLVDGEEIDRLAEDELVALLQRLVQE